MKHNSLSAVAEAIPLVLFFESEFYDSVDELNFQSASTDVEITGVALDRDIEGAGCWVPCRQNSSYVT